MARLDWYNSAVEFDEQLSGLSGRLTVATRGTAGPGEVSLRTAGGTETYIAYSEDPIPRGATVLVLSFEGARTVNVMPWQEPTR